jgi:glycosyltransferase involved in cell wall biosynthesis
LAVTPKLAIFTPFTGVASQTFIRRHIERLHPGATVVLAEQPAKEGAVWEPSCPALWLDEVKRRQGPGRQWRILKRRLGLARQEPWESVAAFLQKEKTEVMLVEFLHKAGPWVQLCRELGIRVFAMGHGHDLSRDLKAEGAAGRFQFLKEADGIITVNRVGRARLEALGIPGDRIHVVHYGVELPEAPAPRLEREEIRCLAVGRMVDKKAPLLVLQAFAAACRRVPGLRLRMIGDGPLLPEARAYVREASLEASVELCGARPHPEVLAAMSEADVFVQHSRVAANGDEEGLPLAILEAMARGCAILSTRHAGIPEAVVHGEGGLLAEENDVEGMREAWERLAEDGALRRRLGAGARTAVERGFTWEHERANLRGLLRLKP